jgi:hypothetical protein
MIVTMTKTLRSACLAGLTLALAACGGGGGGESGGSPVAPQPSPPPPTAAQALVINSDNMVVVAALAPSWGEILLELGHIGVDYANRFRTSASAVTETCPNGGLATLTLLDRDADGKLSAGDRVVAELQDCGIAVLNTILHGTYSVDVAAVGGAPAALRGEVTFGGGSVVLKGTSGSLSGATIQLRGSFAFDWSRTDVRTSLAIASSAADDFRLVGSEGAVTVTEAVHAIGISKVLQYDEARARFSMALRYESEVLGGSVTISTPQVMQSYLDTYPESGRIDVRGAGGVVLNLLPNFVVGNDQVTAGLDTDGDERIDSTVSMPWSNVFGGYTWWGGRSLPSYGSYNAFYTGTYQSTGFLWNASSPFNVGVNDTFWIQFSRPPVDLPPLVFRLRDLGSWLISDNRVDIEADTTVQGAVVLIKPRTPLRHARNYQLEYSSDGGQTWGQYLTVHDALGNSTVLTGGNSIQTPDSMRTRITGGGVMLLDAGSATQFDGSASTSTRAITSYRWRQISGTPLAIATPDSPSTEVRWGPTPPSGVEQAVLEFTITDAAGETESDRVTVTAANYTGRGGALYFRSTAGDWIGGGRTFIGGSPAASLSANVYSSGQLVVNYTEPQLYGSSWSLNITSSGPLQAGSYENTQYPNGPTALLFSGNATTCGTASGRFDVLEIGYDHFGTVTKLAIDFEQHCGSATSPPLYGSVRINSAIPIRR